LETLQGEQLVVKEHQKVSQMLYCSEIPLLARFPLLRPVMGAAAAHRRATPLSNKRLPAALQLRS